MSVLNIFFRDPQQVNIKQMSHYKIGLIIHAKVKFTEQIGSDKKMKSFAFTFHSIQLER